MPTWWQEAVFFQIYPRSFCDTDGDGVGDLEGIRRHLDHLVQLGVDALWISPFFRSPMADYGYDVSDYCDVDPLFGDLAAFDRLVTEAHATGLKVMIDWVPNHTSDQHPWFVSSRADPDGPHGDWYVWRNGTPDAPPNGWKAAFADVPAWTWDEGRGQWYLHLFLAEQPDLDWSNPAVEAAMHDTLRFWLDRGVDGFRMDVVHCIGKPEGLADFPPGASPVSSIDEEVTHERLRRIRGVLDSYDGDRTSIGEVYLLDSRKVARYYGDHDELHLSFNFVPLWTAWEADGWRKAIDRTYDALDPVDAWPSWVLSNHDVPRHRTRYGGSEARARAAAVLLLTQKGTPFLYAGEELGLLDADVPAERVLDPGGRDGCRAPVPWDSSASHGWSTEDPWLPWPPEAEDRNVAAAVADSGSVFHLYKRLLTARRASSSLRAGTFQWLPSPDGVLAYARASGDDRRVALVSFVAVPTSCPVDGDWVVEVSTDRVEGGSWTGTLAGDQAVILRPA